MADQGTSEPRMSEHLRQILASMRETVRPWLPKRLQGGGAVVPVVRLSGTIGLSTPLRPGLTLCLHRQRRTPVENCWRQTQQLDPTPSTSIVHLAWVSAPCSGQRGQCVRLPTNPLRRDLQTDEVDYKSALFLCECVLLVDPFPV